jgi:hypothetical protein
MTGANAASEIQTAVGLRPCGHGVQELDWRAAVVRWRSNKCKQRRTNMAISPSASLDKRETVSLIGSDKVEGTSVYRSNGEKAGRIERVMIDKISGKVAYAVMSFGGFMGIGEDYYPLPWSVLTYNPRLDGYEVNITEQQLKGAPHYGKHESWDWTDRTRGQKVYDYYGATPYWT